MSEHLRQMWREATRRTSMDYWTGHRPSQMGAPAHDLLAPDEEQGVPLYPDDIYDRPDYYTGFRDLIPEVKRLLHSIRGNPNAPVTIYRALPPNKGTRFETGDWVSLSREYAEMHGEDRGWEEWVEPKVPNVFEEGEGWVQHDGDWPIISATVPASTVRFAGDDLMEWGYWGGPVPGKVVPS